MGPPVAATPEVEEGGVLVLDLSGNELGDEAGKEIGEAIATDG